MGDPSTPDGVLEIVAACEQLIRDTPEKDGFSYAQAVMEIRIRTGLEKLTKKQVERGMWAANERLHDAGLPGARNIPRWGWRRETPEDRLDFANTRMHRSRRQICRGLTVAAAIPWDRLNPERRDQLDFIRRVSTKAADLLQQREKRQRPPLPPADQP